MCVFYHFLNIFLIFFIFPCFPFLFLFFFVIAFFVFLLVFLFFFKKKKKKFLPSGRPKERHGRSRHRPTKVFEFVKLDLRP